MNRYLEFTNEDVLLPFSFKRSLPDESYLAKLRADYKLDELIAGKEKQYDKVRAICKWAHSRWMHDGRNEPQFADPIFILEEAKNGERFRCVEYSIVLNGALNAIGIPARVLRLKTEDVETRESSAGHVVAEAFLAELNKWIMVDGQFDAIPVANGLPLNAVEFQKVLAEANNELMIDSLSNRDAQEYFEWIAEYLFYFDTAFDNRFGVTPLPQKLMLIPVGANRPTVFQRKYPIDNVTYIHSIKTFYASPIRDQKVCSAIKN